ncbi:MAG TPA: hypothetical protein VG984_00820 [Candidatus Paceibacterota bacterium]|nr:hypothetical protein [Candidatus Paceibacterota bacterium]
MTADDDSNFDPAADVRVLGEARVNPMDCVVALQHGRPDAPNPCTVCGYSFPKPAPKPPVDE